MADGAPEVQGHVARGVFWCNCDYYCLGIMRIVPEQTFYNHSKKLQEWSRKCQRVAEEEVYQDPEAVEGDFQQINTTPRNSPSNDVPGNDHIHEPDPTTLNNDINEPDAQCNSPTLPENNEDPNLDPPSSDEGSLDEEDECYDPRSLGH